MIKITDPDLVDKIRRVEDQFDEIRIGGKDSDVSTASCLKKWREFRAKKEEEAETSEYWMDLLTNPEREMTVPNCVIYGEGGWNRYYVLLSGEVVFSAHHGPGSVEKAEKAGFKIWH